MELDYKAIGKRIKIARIRADITQERLADLADLSPSHMSNIETGTTRVSLTTVVNIANALSVTVDDLLCDNVVRAKPQFENDIQILIDSCDDYEIRIVKDLLMAIISTLRRDSSLRKENIGRRMMNPLNDALVSFRHFYSHTSYQSLLYTSL